MNLPDPSIPIPDARREEYCSLRALGAGRTEAYVAAAPLGGKPARSSAKSCAYRWEQDPVVCARIEYLAADRRSDAPQTAILLDRPAAILPAMRRLSEALSAAATRLAAEGASENDLAALRSTLSAHSARALEIERLCDAPEQEAPAAGKRIDPSRIPRGGRHACQCPAK